MQPSLSSATMPIIDFEYDELTKTLTDNFNTLADEVQLLSDRKIILEHKLRYAHEQVSTYGCVFFFGRWIAPLYDEQHSSRSGAATSSSYDRQTPCILTFGISATTIVEYSFRSSALTRSTTVSIFSGQVCSCRSGNRKHISKITTSSRPSNLSPGSRRIRPTSSTRTRQLQATDSRCYQRRPKSSTKVSGSKGKYHRIYGEWGKKHIRGEQ